jgi:hypothetical protein
MLSPRSFANIQKTGKIKAYEQKKALFVLQNKKGLIAYVNPVRLDTTNHEDTGKDLIASIMTFAGKLS